MRRRDLLLAAAGLAAAPRSAGAQGARQRPPVVGYLTWGRDTPEAAERLDAFRRELAMLGWAEGGNLTLLTRRADGDAATGRAILAQWVQERVDLIVTGSTPAVHAARDATGTIPIVMHNIADPLSTGLVQSLARPGGNVTGLTFLGPEVAPKRVELLAELVPGLKRLGFLGAAFDPNGPVFARHVEGAARLIGATVRPVLLPSADGIEAALAGFAGQVDAVAVQPIFLTGHASRVARAALGHGLPAISDEAVFARAGGLASYGVEWTAMSRRAAHFVDKILKGANPAEIPIEVPSELELVLNAATARRLGLTIPPALLARADEVIE